MKDVRLLADPFIPGALVGPFTMAHPGLGGVCSFVGEVRLDNGVEALELRHFAPLTLPGMEALADSALDRFDLMGILIVHRTGLMQPGAVVAPDRADPDNGEGVHSVHRIGVGAFTCGTTTPAGGPSSCDAPPG